MKELGVGKVEIGYLPKISIWTGATPLPIMPKSRAAPAERSIIRPPISAHGH